MSLPEHRRLIKDWSKIAGEKIGLGVAGETPYAFCSEQGVIRLQQKLGTGDIGYSEDMKVWYYTPDDNL